MRIILIAIVIAFTNIAIGMESKRVLSFGAHPDDIEIGCAGTEYQLIQQGYEVTHVYVTSGEAGSQEIPKNKLAKIREEEAQQSAKILGVKSVRFLKFPDGLTHFTEDMRIQVINIIREIQPDIIFVHGNSDLFPDHKIVNQLVLSAAKASAGPWFQNSVGKPWAVAKIYGYEVWHPMSEYQVAINITPSIDTKIKALSAFKSQIGPTRYDEAFKGLARYRGVMSWAGEYAEVFEVLKTSPV